MLTIFESGGNGIMIKSGWENLRAVGTVHLRFGLVSSFISAVRIVPAGGERWASRTGLGRLCEVRGIYRKAQPFLPATLIPPLAIFATCVEMLPGLLLLALGKRGSRLW